MSLELILTFTAELIEWRGPAPFYFLRVPELEAKELSKIANQVSYGWGVIPCDVTLGEIDFYTALIPKDGSYLVPLKKSIRSAASVNLGDPVTATLRFDRD